MTVVSSVALIRCAIPSPSCPCITADRCALHVSAYLLVCLPTLPLPCPVCSFTLATLPSGLPQGQTGDIIMKTIQQVGLTNYYVNLMTMDYGPGACATPCNMGQAAINAANAVKSVYGVPYNRIEVTPMIGGNDVTTEVFTLNDVATVASFAKTNGLGGIHWWSYDRDRDCPSGSASATCNTYGSAGTLGFANSFAANLAGWNNYGSSPPAPPPPVTPSPSPKPPTPPPAGGKSTAPASLISYE